MTSDISNETLDSNGIPGLVGDVVRDAIGAIGAEIIAASNDSTSTIELRNGRFVGRTRIARPLGVRG